MFTYRDVFEDQAYMLAELRKLLTRSGEGGRAGLAAVHPIEVGPAESERAGVDIRPRVE